MSYKYNKKSKSDTLENKKNVSLDKAYTIYLEQKSRKI